MMSPTVENDAPVYTRGDMERAWDEGYRAGQTFGWEYAKDTYDGPDEDTTLNPYARVIPPDRTDDE
jgi:hypothetical protein